MAVIATIEAPGNSDTFKPSAGVPFNITIRAAADAEVRVMRVFHQSRGEDASEPFEVISDTLRKALPESFSWEESGANVAYYAEVVDLGSGDDVLVRFEK